ncbi:MAG: DUF1501 domain-containing protein [Pirellulaceae bacterium]|jgi:hypothetical protein|nr:DUF1501 domain-containing protein [Pirellulaceae bacterium]
MLTIFGSQPQSAQRKSGFCDRLVRRDFLKIGGMALGGLSLPQILRAEAAESNSASSQNASRSHKAIINVFLPGGPPHIDMWDLKPDAPAEIRGEYSPIKTTVPGMEICELFPKLASMAERFAIIRSIADSDGDHSAFQCMTGRRRSEQPPPGGWPAMGSWVSKLKGSVNPSVPAHTSLMYKTGHGDWGNPGDGGFLGLGHSPFRLVGGKGNGMKADNMVLQGVTLDRLHDRDSLRSSLDQFRRAADASGSMDGLDEFSQKAMGILTTSKLADALDLSQEDPQVLAKYGVDDPEFERDGAPRMVRNFCIARRLIEAGARVVSMNFIRWDWHGGDGMNFVNSKRDFPLLDAGLSSLLTDLADRGLDRDVSVVVWGEFGRTPRLNNRNSRDHWPQANCAVVAGGGMKLGQVIGATNKYAEHPVDRPIKFQEIFATLYAKAGLPLTTREFDLRGRPQYLVEPGIEPIRELM